MEEVLNMNNEIMKGKDAIAETRGRVARELNEVQRWFEHELQNLAAGKAPNMKGAIAGAAKTSGALVDNAGAAAADLTPESVAKAVKFVKSNAQWLEEHNIPLI